MNLSIKALVCLFLIIPKLDSFSQNINNGLFIRINSYLESSETNGLTDLEKELIIDSAKITVQKVFELSNNLKFIDGLNYYSRDSDAYFTNNGAILSLTDLKKSYSQICTSVEVLENSIDNWNSTFISENTVAFTLPIHLKIKLVGISEYKGQVVWTGVVQKRNNNLSF
jgi:hypothetical protein